MRGLSVEVVLIAAALLLLGCSGNSLHPDGSLDGGVDGRADGTDADGGEADADEESDGPRDGAPRSGPATHVVSEVEVVSERICDLDGDGTYDNVFADLGSPYSELTASFFSNVADGAVESRGLRFVIHSPWIADLSIPEDPAATVIMFIGADTDDPEDPTDDFSGEEPFYVTWRTLDACGEPKFHFREVAIEAGTMSGTIDVLPFPFFGDDVDIVIHGGQIEGTLSPGGREITLWTCGYGLINDLGSGAGPTEVDDITALELLLSGGRAAGMPGIPGLKPDVDVDGDGIEQFVIDENGRIERCIDGDETVIEGRDCWQDERIADGFSFTIQMRTTTALFAGRQPGWEQHFEGDVCDGGPPERSVFDPP